MGALSRRRRAPRLRTDGSRDRITGSATRAHPKARVCAAMQRKCGCRWHRMNPGPAPWSRSQRPDLDAMPSLQHESWASIRSDADPAQTAHFVGFRVTDYSDTAATIWLATRMPDGITLTAASSSVVWLGDDQLALPDPKDAAGESDRLRWWR